MEQDEKLIISIDVGNVSCEFSCFRGVCQWLTTRSNSLRYGRTSVLERRSSLTLAYKFTCDSHCSEVPCKQSLSHAEPFSHTFPHLLRLAESTSSSRGRMLDARSEGKSKRVWLDSGSRFQETNSTPSRTVAANASKTFTQEGQDIAASRTPSKERPAERYFFEEKRLLGRLDSQRNERYASSIFHFESREQRQDGLPWSETERYLGSPSTSELFPLSARTPDRADEYARTSSI
jgi:hypothetical protein